MEKIDYFLMELDEHIGNAPFGYMLFIVSEDNVNLVYVNKRVCDYTGFSKEECINDGKIEIIKQKEIVKAIIDVATDDLQININLYVNQFQKSFDVCMYSFKKGTTVVSIRDNTKNYLYQNALYSTVPIFEEIFFVKLKDDYFKLVYPFDGNFEGKYSELLMKRFDSDIIHKDYLNIVKSFLDKDNIQSNLKDKEFIECKYKRLSTSGIYEWFIICITPINKINDEYESVTLSIRCIDVYEKEEIEKKKKLEIALKEANSASVAKSTFLSTMSHDIRTPLNVILGMASIAKKYMGDLSKLEDAINKIESSGKHLLSLINEVLDMSKIESGKIEMTNNDFCLPSLISETLDMLEEIIYSKKQKIYFDSNGLIHECVIGDRNRLQQILINIISNASKYTKDGGTINISIKEDYFSDTNSSVYSFNISDNGIGMSKEYIEKIFEPFSREVDSRVSKIEGTGLGMSISLNLIKLMGGNINVDSEQGVGTIVYLQIPLKINEKEISFCKHKDIDVLIVDDLLSEAEELGNSLNNLCGNIDYVRTCDMAMEKIKENNYSMLLIDTFLPAMDTIELIKNVKKYYPLVSVVVTTDYDKSFIQDLASRIGIDYILMKPIFKSQLSRLLDLLFNKNSFDNQKKLNLNALLIDDNDLNIEIAVEFLKELGVRCDVAMNGEEGVSLFKKSKIGEYDCIFMDIEMPIMNGIVATKIIRGLNRSDATNIPIFAMTANAFSSDIRNVMENGMNDHISKPISFPAITKVLHKWFR